MTPLLLLVLAGCTQVVRFPPPFVWQGTGDTGAPTLGAQITWASASCDAQGSAWEVMATSDDVVTVAVVDIFDTGGSSSRVEQHPLAPFWDAEGRSWRMQTGPLADGVAEADWQSGVNSVFDCNVDAPKLSFSLRVWDATRTLSDCVVWGQNPDAAAVHAAALSDLTALGGCTQLRDPP